MILTGKVKFIELSVKKDWLTVVLTKRRYGKLLEMAIFFPMGKFGASVRDGALCVGLTIDVTCFVYSKKRGEYWDSYIVAEKWRKYAKGAKRTREVADPKTGLIVELKDRF